MARDIEEIRREIEETRGRLRATSEAIGWKADLPARARDVIRETAGVVRERVRNPEREPGRPTGGVGSRPSLGERVRETRGALAERMGSAKEAVGSVAGAAAEKAGAAREAVVEGAGSATDSVSGIREQAADRLPSGGDLREGAGRAVGVARANPVPMALGALAVGVAAGLLLPRTEVEDERIGPLADEVKERGADIGREAAERGREVAQEAIERGRTPSGSR
jgi:hypothetical protein